MLNKMWKTCLCLGAVLLSFPAMAQSTQPADSLEPVSPSDPRPVSPTTLPSSELKGYEQKLQTQIEVVERAPLNSRAKALQTLIEQGQALEATAEDDAAKLKAYEIQLQSWFALIVQHHQQSAMRAGYLHLLKSEAKRVAKTEVKGAKELASFWLMMGEVSGLRFDEKLDPKTKSLSIEKVMQAYLETNEDAPEALKQNLKELQRRNDLPE